MYRDRDTYRSRLSLKVHGLQRNESIGGFVRACGERRGAESGPLRAVHLSRHKWPGGRVNYLDKARRGIVRARSADRSARLGRAGTGGGGALRWRVGGRVWLGEVV